MQLERPLRIRRRLAGLGQDTADTAPPLSQEMVNAAFADTGAVAPLPTDAAGGFDWSKTITSFLQPLSQAYGQTQQAQAAVKIAQARAVTPYGYTYPTTYPSVYPAGGVLPGYAAQPASSMMPLLLIGLAVAGGAYFIYNR